MSLIPKHVVSAYGHRRAASLHTLDTVIGSPLSPTTSPQSSTASTQSSFSTAFTTLDQKLRFHYYLPHISTADEAVYTQTDTYACNLSPTTPFLSLPAVQFDRFYQYMPDLSGEEDDVYTDGVKVMYDTLRGPGHLHVQPEQKVIGKFRAVRYDDTSNKLLSPRSYAKAKHSADRPETCVAEVVDEGVCGPAAGECVGSIIDVSTAFSHGEEKKRTKLRKEKYRRSISLAEISEKVKDMLRKLHIGKKTERAPSSCSSKRNA